MRDSKKEKRTCEEEEGRNYAGSDQSTCSWTFSPFFEYPIFNLRRSLGGRAWKENRISI